MSPLRRVVESVATRALDAVAFTSAPAAVSFLQTTDDMALFPVVTGALHDTVVAACVGPVTAAPLDRAGIPTLIPERWRRTPAMSCRGRTCSD